MSGRECPQCGEALMGAVNRCWKCGLDLRAESRPGSLPVSRTAQEPLIVAELAEAPAASNAVAGNAAQAVSPPIPNPTEPAIGAESPVLEFGPNGSLLRRGSPFAANAMLLPPRQVPEFGASAARHKKPSLQQAHASNGGAIAALVLGIFGLILAPLRFEGAIVGMVGLMMGIWGLYSQRRGWALAGLILCCLAIAIGMYTGVYWLFKFTNNATPWEY
jgi:hypothetical protein